MYPGVSFWQRERNTFIAGILVFALVLPVLARNVAQEKELALAAFDVAERMREELSHRPQDRRTRRDYQHVADAYKRVYWDSPTCSKADASVFNMAGVLAEAGRRFNEPKTLKDAIAQYEFLRREYPGSKYRIDALFAIGQTYADLGDTAQAKATFEEFLRRYPRSHMGEEARAAMASLEHPQEKKKEKEVERPRDPAAGHETSAIVPVSAPAAATAAPATRSPLPMVTGIRHWSTPDYTRVAIDLDTEVQYQAGRVPGPDRIFFDLHDTKLASALVGKSFDVQDGFLRRIRVAQFARGITRVVLEVDDVSDYSAFLLPNPYRLIIDVHGRRAGQTRVAKGTPRPSNDKGTTEKTQVAKDKPVELPNAPSAIHNEAPLHLSTRVADGSTAPLKHEPEIAAHAVTTAAAEKPQTRDSKPRSARTETAQTSAGHKAAGRTVTESKSAEKSATAAATSSHEPSLRPVAEKPKSVTDDSADLTLARLDPPELRTSKPTSAPTFESVAPREKRSVHAAEPTASGERSLIRALGLKIGRIVVDAGHGGYDTGTIGPGGLQEKDVVLDVAQRLGKLLQTKLGAEVTYTRDSDVFIPLETRTAIANQNQADLFISIHANSSKDSSARGVETYYLNFTSSADALEVAARENAVSQKSVFQLQDLVKRIALKEKIEESREFAADVQNALWSGEAAKSPNLRNRGVKKAPFVVLIGANMPSILAEISFLSNPGDEKQLKTTQYRQKIAEYLYHGIARYANGLSGVKVAQRRDSGH